MPDDTRRFVGANGMKGRPMRRVFCCALLVLGLAVVGFRSPACAQDLPFLRGTETVGQATYTRWSGFYFGGQASFNYGQTDFSGTTAPLVALALQDTVVESVFAPSQLQALSKGAQSAFGFGGFLGYNTQWEDVIFGVEANYTRASLSMGSPSSPAISRSFSPAAGNVTSVTIQNANAHLSLTDYVEARGRAGYIIGNVLPYGFVGVVIGRSSYSASVEVDATCTGGGECVGYPLTPSSGQSNALLYGLAAGAGVEWALTPNFFLRGEIEGIQFASYANTNVTIFDARVGAGFKF
jgi:outer membrane immunogenic protein